MKVSMDFPVAVLGSTFVLATLLLYYKYKLLCKKEVVGRKIPEPGFAWPIIGHLHLLAANDGILHKVLADMANKCGPLFRLRLGSHQVLVVSDSRIAKECLTTNDKALAGRPKAISSEYIGYNYASMAIAPANDFWREVRKTVVLELLSNTRLERLRGVRELGVRTFSQDIYKRWLKDQNNESGYVMLDMQEWFGKLIIGLMLQILFGKRYEDVGSWVATTLRRSFELMAASVVGDFLPWLRWLDIGGYEKAIRENAKDLDSVMESFLKEHKIKRNTKSKGEEDFMDVMLSRVHSNNAILKYFDADTAVKATCTAVLAGGSDTSSTTLTWALSLILNDNGNVLEKIRSELDIHVGRERHVTWSDLNNLTYLQAVIKETFRLCPAGPVLVPHESVEDCVINSYQVSKGTRLLINVSKIERDPNFWSDPNTFKPERFLTEYKEVDVKGNHFELLPFGCGRRICPAITLALQNLQLSLASVIHDFDIKRCSNEPIDMTEAPGLAIAKATPLDVLLAPRLSSHLYL